jgi:hypothetical protein
MNNIKSSLIATCCLTLLPLATQADYSVVFVRGSTLFANHLDHPGGNRAGLLFPNPQDGMTITKWDGTNWSAPFMYDLLSGGWTPSEPVINPGEGAALDTPTAFTNTFTGTPHDPSLPVTMVPGQYFYLLSDQTAEIGSWESITGTVPSEGSQVQVFNVANQTNYVIYTYHQGAWQPTTPSIPVGVSAFFTPIMSLAWVSRDFYFDVDTNHAGGGIADLVADAKYPDKPSLSDVALGFQINNDIARSNYGARVRTYFTPVTSGVYEFFVYNDDAAQLFLSTDISETNLQMLIDSPTVQTNFDTTVMGTSPPLTGGQRYLLQALYRQNTGGAVLGVAVRLKGDVTPPPLLSFLNDEFSTITDPNQGRITFVQQPQSTSTGSGSRATFTVNATSVGPKLYYQWLSNAVPILNANRATYTTPVLSTSNSNDVYQVRVSAGGQSRLSAPGFLTVYPGNPSRMQPYVGVNFMSSDVSSVGDTLAGFLWPNDVAGAVRQENFNNLSVLSANAIPLIDSAGAPTPITISYGRFALAATGTGGSDADHTLLQGYIHNGNKPVTVTLSNIPPGTNYSLLVYTVGVSSNATYEEAFDLKGTAAYPTLHVRAQDANQYLAASAYTRMSSTDPNARDLGNYVEFDNVAPAVDGSLVLVVTPESTSPGAALLPPVNALQLVAVQPPPAPPPLSVQYNAAANTVTIGWTDGAAGFTLRSTSVLGTNANWTVVRDVSSPIAGASSFTSNVSSNSPSYYQLVHKEPTPVIIQQPQSQIVPVGAVGVSFSVVVSNAVSPQYQWTFNKTSILFATNSVYTIPTPVDFTNVGDYQVIIYDDIMYSANAALSVYNSGTLETPISQFSSQRTTCATYQHAYFPPDWFYGPKAFPQYGAFKNSVAKGLALNTSSPVNNGANALTAVQYNFPNYDIVPCPPRSSISVTLSTASGDPLNGAPNSYYGLVIYSTPPPSGKIDLNWAYQ